MRKNPIIFGLFLLILAGALLQSCEDDSTSSTDISYSEDISSVMTNYCLTCHSGTAPEAGLDLSNYANVKAIGETGKLVDRINDAASPMPPSGLMPTVNREKIEDWIDGGYQE